MNQIMLNGDIRQQANQFWELLKTRELTSKTLQEIMPNASGFYKELIHCINNEIFSDKEICISAIEAYKEILSNLSQGLTDKEIKFDEKKIIADKISEICHLIHDIEREHSKKSSSSTSMILCFCAASCFIITFLLSKSKE